ncbi:unnamed protein product [Lupinus luteus]|uniref:Uncharacterized protein n=1 Tax=Lupinus luteus TaxID=3873 RepID=A0AAV1VYU6_LUPLU
MRRAVLVQPLDPTSGGAISRVGRLLNRKDNSFRGPADVSGLPNVVVSRNDRLTHVQVPFTWNLSPLRPSKFSFEYLLLPPRSAPTTAPPGLTPQVLQRPPCPPTHRGLALAPTARYALTRTLHRRSGSVDGATHKGIPPISFRAPYGFTCPLTRTHVRLLAPCFKTGRMGNPQADARSTQVQKPTETARASNHNRDDDVSTSMSTAQAWATITIHVGPCPESIGGPALAVPHPTEAHPLDGIYRPIGAAFPNNPARQQRLVVRQGPGTTGLSPSPAPPSRGLGPGPLLRTLLQTTIRTPRATDSHGGLFPVRPA